MWHQKQVVESFPNGRESSRCAEFELVERSLNRFGARRWLSVGDIAGLQCDLSFADGVEISDIDGLCVLGTRLLAVTVISQTTEIGALLQIRSCLRALSLLDAHGVVPLVRKAVLAVIAENESLWGMQLGSYQYPLHVVSLEALQSALSWHHLISSSTTTVSTLKPRPGIVIDGEQRGAGRV